VIQGSQRSRCTRLPCQHLHRNISQNISLPHYRFFLSSDLPTPATSRHLVTTERLLFSSRENPWWSSSQSTPYMAGKSQQNLWPTEASSHQFSLPSGQRPKPPPPVEYYHCDLPESALVFTSSRWKISPPLRAAERELYAPPKVFSKKFHWSSRVFRYFS